jgi:gluconokinase
MVVIIFGVSGAGKTTIGKLLARKLGWAFYEGDDFHPPVNVEKMRNGIPLTDKDRQPWLAKLRKLVEKALAAGQNAVLACSALKKKYRDGLRAGAQVRFVFLHGDRAQIAKQLRQRRGHFIDPALLDSQFADLEEPAPEEHAIVIELGRNPDVLVGEIRSKLGLEAR